MRKLSHSEVNASCFGSQTSDPKVGWTQAAKSQGLHTMFFTIIRFTTVIGIVVMLERYLRVSFLKNDIY